MMEVVMKFKISISMRVNMLLVFLEESQVAMQ